MLRSRRAGFRLRLAALLVLAIAGGACSTPRDPIIVDEGMVVVENLTPRNGAT